MLIKVAPKDYSNGITIPTNFAMPNPLYSSYSKTYFSYKPIAIFIVEIAYLSHRFAVQIIPPTFWPHSVKYEFTNSASL